MMKEEKLAFENSFRGKLAAVAHWPAPGGPGPTAPVVVLCHGMESSKDGPKHVETARRLAARGIVAFRFDFSFSGESGGSFEEITFSQEVRDLGAAVAFVRTLSTGPIGLFGSSMGGAVAVLHAGSDPAIRCLATLAAVAHPDALANRFLAARGRKVEPGDLVELGSGQKVRAGFFLDALTQDVIGAARRIVAPCLVIHGVKDEIVPVSDGKDLHGALAGPKELALLPEADHRVSDPRLLGEVVELVVDWFARWMLPRSSSSGN